MFSSLGQVNGDATNAWKGRDEFQSRDENEHSFVECSKQKAWITNEGAYSESSFDENVSDKSGHLDGESRSRDSTPFECIELNQQKIDSILNAQPKNISGMKDNMMFNVRQCIGNLGIEDENNVISMDDLVSMLPEHIENEKQNETLNDFRTIWGNDESDEHVHECSVPLIGGKYSAPFEIAAGEESITTVDNGNSVDSECESDCLSLVETDFDCFELNSRILSKEPKSQYRMTRMEKALAKKFKNPIDWRLEYSAQACNMPFGTRLVFTYPPMIMFAPAHMTKNNGFIGAIALAIRDKGTLSSLPESSLLRSLDGINVTQVPFADIVNLMGRNISNLDPMTMDFEFPPLSTVPPAEHLDNYLSSEDDPIRRIDHLSLKVIKETASTFKESENKSNPAIFLNAKARTFVPRASWA